MSARTTKRDLEELLKSTELARDHWQKSYFEKCAALKKSEEEYASSVEQCNIAEQSVESLKGRCHKLEIDLVDAARIEVFEFLARLKHGAKGGSSTSGPVHPSLSNGVSPAYDAFRSPR